MEKEFIPYELALKMKALGFDEPCFGYYISLGDNKETPFKLLEQKTEKGQFECIDNVYQVPTFSQAFRFFRENYGYCSYIIEAVVNTYRFHIEKFDEEAELECLKKLIELVNNK